MITPDWAKDAYRRLVKIRLTEETIAAEYKHQEMRCPVHLSIGQEAVAAGVSLTLRDEDVVFSTHRCHSHYLAKGGGLDEMIAELYGKRTGCAAGVGGSMHLIDKQVGMLGSSAIVGGSIPLAVGAALSFRMSGEPRVAVPFFGDGAAEEGVFHESMNFAALKQLPVVFLCENNFTATASPLSARRARDNIFEHGYVFGIPGVSVDGNDVVAVYETAREAVEKARRGDGPSLIEARTFRWMRHVGPEEDQTSGDRTPEKCRQWREQCPVRRFEAYSADHGLLAPAEQEQIRSQVTQEIQQAFERAQAAPAAEWI